jgi:uncharacterized protein YbbK (DUF523 family)
MTSPASVPPRRRIRLGISACLLGDEVRYDGGHKRDAFLTTILAPLVEWVKVCPEVEVGMGTPREPIHLVNEGGGIRLQTVTTAIDHTDSMTAFAAKRVDALAAENLSGYILKAGSPSCGLAGPGLFAQALLARFPDLPIADEEQLADPEFRENFLARVFAYGMK